MTNELLGNPRVLFVLVGIVCAIAMTLYWERDGMQRLGRELVAVMRGSDADRRRKRAMLIGLAIATLLMGVVIVTAGVDAANHG